MREYVPILMAMDFIKWQPSIQLKTGLLEDKSAQCDSQSLRQFGGGNANSVHLITHLALHKAFPSVCLKINRIMIVIITPLVFTSIFPITLLSNLSKKLKFEWKLRSFLWYVNKTKHEFIEKIM